MTKAHSLESLKSVTPIGESSIASNRTNRIASTQHQLILSILSIVMQHLTSYRAKQLEYCACLCCESERLWQPEKQGLTHRSEKLSIPLPICDVSTFTHNLHERSSRRFCASRRRSDGTDCTCSTIRALRKRNKPAVTDLGKQLDHRKTCLTESKVANRDIGIQPIKFVVPGKTTVLHQSYFFFTTG